MADFEGAAVVGLPAVRTGVPTPVEAGAELAPVAVGLAPCPDVEVAVAEGFGAPGALVAAADLPGEGDTEGAPVPDAGVTAGSADSGARAPALGGGVPVSLDAESSCAAAPEAAIESAAGRVKTHSKAPRMPIPRSAEPARTGALQPPCAGPPTGMFGAEVVTGEEVIGDEVVPCEAVLGGAAHPGPEPMPGFGSAPGGAISVFRGAEVGGSGAVATADPGASLAAAA